MRRSQYTMPVLKAWYNRTFASYYKKPKLVVIIPDFENFQRDILQQFILLLSHNCETLPLVLVLGVATDLTTLHRTLSFSDTSRLSLQVFQSPPSTQSLNNVPFVCPLIGSLVLINLFADSRCNIINTKMCIYNVAQSIHFIDGYFSLL